MIIGSPRAHFFMNVENKINNISNPKQPILPPERKSDLLNMVWIRKAPCSLPNDIPKPRN